MQSIMWSATSGTRSPVWNQVRWELAGDRILYIMAAFYLIAGGAAISTFGGLDRFLPIAYLQLWIIGAVHSVPIFILVVLVPRAMKDGSRRPLTDAVATAYRRTLLPRVMAGIVLILVHALFWSVFTSVKNTLPNVAPVWFDRQIADFDFALHGSNDAWRLLQPFVGYQPITRLIEILYLNVWLLILTVFPAVLALGRDAGGLRIRYFATSFLILIVLGNVCAALGMSAGPVYYGYVTGDGGRFADLIDYLSFSKGQVSSAADVQDYLWHLFSTNQTHVGSGISAHPSIHVAMATLFFLAGRSLSRKLGAVFFAYLVIIMIGSVHLGWHYAVDGYASVLGTYAIWHGIGALQRLGAGTNGWVLPSGARPDVASCNSQ